MKEELREYLYCFKCQRRLTPLDVTHYGTLSHPRCADCRTVVRRSLDERRDMVLTAAGVPRNGHLNTSDAVYNALRQLKNRSWIAYLLIYSYGISFDYHWDLIDGVVSYRDVRGRAIRQRVGRFVRALMPAEALENLLVDQDFEIFINDINALLTTPTYEWKLLTGKDIRAAYHERSYAEDTGQLSNSCMAYSRCQGFFRIYEENPDVCQLLTTWNQNGKLTGRALLWTLTNGEKMIDRVYGNDVTIRMFANYASEHGYVKRRINRGDTAEVQLDSWKFIYYPYMDTMNYMYPLTGVLTIKYDDSDTPSMGLSGTNGNYGRYGKWIECPSCRRRSQRASTEELCFVCLNNVPATSVAVEG